MKDETTAKAAPSLNHPNRVLQAGMYLLALGAGVGTSAFKIWDEYYRKIKQTDAVQAMSSKRYEKINALLSGPAISNEEYAQQVSTIEKDYTHEVNVFLKKQIGLETEKAGSKIKATLQRFEALGPYKKANILFSGAVAMGTTIGAYFLLNQNALLKKDLRDLHGRLDDQSNNR